MLNQFRLRIINVIVGVLIPEGTIATAALILIITLLSRQEKTCNCPVPAAEEGKTEGRGPTGARTIGCCDAQDANSGMTPARRNVALIFMAGLSFSLWPSLVCAGRFLRCSSKPVPCQRGWADVFPGFARPFNPQVVRRRPPVELDVPQAEALLVSYDHETPENGRDWVGCRAWHTAS